MRHSKWTGHALKKNCHFVKQAHGELVSYEATWEVSLLCFFSRCLKSLIISRETPYWKAQRKTFATVIVCKKCWGRRWHKNWFGNSMVQDFAKAETQKTRKGWSATHRKYMGSVIGKNRGQKILPHWVLNQISFWES